VKVFAFLGERGWTFSTFFTGFEKSLKFCAFYTSNCSGHSKESLHVVEHHNDLLSERKYVQVTGAGIRHTRCILSQGGENSCSLYWATMVYMYSNLMYSKALTLSDAGLCSSTSQMGRSCPGTSSLHGYWFSTDCPLGTLPRGWALYGASTPFPHTCTLTTIAGSRVQTIYRPKSILLLHCVWQHFVENLKLQ
jgi:hypothetical protein